MESGVGCATTLHPGFGICLYHERDRPGPHPVRSLVRRRPTAPLAPPELASPNGWRLAARENGLIDRKANVDFATVDGRARLGCEGSALAIFLLGRPWAGSAMLGNSSPWPYDFAARSAAITVHGPERKRGNR